MKKILLGLGILPLTTLPIVVMTSCGFGQEVNEKLNVRFIEASGRGAIENEYINIDHIISWSRSGATIFIYHTPYGNSSNNYISILDNINYDIDKLEKDLLKLVF